MAGWTLPLVVSCLLLSRVAGANDTGIDPFAEYQYGGAKSVCRETVAAPSPDDVARREDLHAVTHVDSLGTCGDFCDAIKPCYGFEFVEKNPKTHYGNCEIWIVPILRFKITNEANFHCYNKTSTYSSSDKANHSVMPGFSIANLTVAEILANQSLLANIGQSLYLLVTSYINTSVITMNAMPGVTEIANGTGLHLRFTFSSTQLHSAELHNAIRVVGLTGGRKHSGTWGAVTIDHPPGLLAQIQSYFAGLTDYIMGTPTTTADFITLTPLAPVIGAPTQDGTTTTESTTASSAHSSRPIILLFGLTLAKIM